MYSENREHGPLTSSTGLKYEAGDGRERACRDRVLEQFAAAILSPNELKPVLRGFYTDALHAALVKRLAALRASEAATLRPRLNALPAWRLHRAYEYVDANLDAKVSLKELANAAGISPMHFAAQFKVATGLRPHDYVVRRRITKSCEMLLENEVPIVAIALSVGFQSQAHFTTVFKRIIGFTPNAWRRLTQEELSNAA